MEHNKISFADTLSGEIRHKASCCFINFNIHKSAENFNHVLYTDKPEDTISIKIRICLGKTRIKCTTEQNTEGFSYSLKYCQKLS